jgi:DNA-binding helix-hairpin-helix protein with protein kinase domain
MSLHLPDGREVRLGGTVLGSGAEGLVYDLAETKDLCAKIYLEPEPDLHQRLISLMRTEPATWRGDHAEHLHVAWPRQPLMDAGGRTIGFLMPLVEGEPLTRLFDPHVRVGAIEEPTWRVIVGVAARTARLLAKLHSAGIVMGDVSPANILVSPSGHVTLLDCDTVQFTDPETNILYRCAKLTPEYAPPASNGSATQVLSPSHDAFCLAVLICQLLMEGDHPFEGVPANLNDVDALASDNIRLQNNRIVFPERFTPVPGAIPVSVLPPDLLQLAQTCFGEGHRDPEARPSPEDWEKSLERAGFELMGCRVNDRHLYHNSLRSCVWCDRVTQGFDDRYPPAFPSPRVVFPQTPQRSPATSRFVAPAPPPKPYAAAPPPKPARDYTKMIKIAIVVAVLIFIVIGVALS